MTDYIEREKAFDAVFGQFCAGSDETEAALNAAIEEIRAIPAADVRPVVRGRWLPTSDANKKRCSRCDVIHLIAQYPHGEINYCPNCGADMREES